MAPSVLAAVAPGARGVKYQNVYDVVPPSTATTFKYTDIQIYEQLFWTTSGKVFLGPTGHLNIRNLIHLNVTATTFKHTSCLWSHIFPISCPISLKQRWISPHRDLNSRAWLRRVREVAPDEAVGY